MNQTRSRSIKNHMWTGYLYNVISYVSIKVLTIEIVDQVHARMTLRKQLNRCILWKIPAFSVMNLEAKSLLVLIAKQIYPPGSHTLINDSQFFSRYIGPAKRHTYFYCFWFINEIKNVSKTTWLTPNIDYLSLGRFRAMSEGLLLWTKHTMEVGG